MAKDHPQSKILPHCWVCEAKFVDAGGKEPRHDHHVFPRAYGGTDGPEVSVCDTHHTKLHRIAECFIASRPHFKFLQGEQTEASRKLLYLATKVHEIHNLTKNDPNKATTQVLVLTARHQQMLDALKPVLKLRSREAVLLKALESLHSRHFVSR